MLGFAARPAAGTGANGIDCRHWRCGRPLGFAAAPQGIGRILPHKQAAEAHLSCGLDIRVVFAFPGGSDPFSMLKFYKNFLKNVIGHQTENGV